MTESGFFGRSPKHALPWEKRGLTVISKKYKNANQNAPEQPLLRVPRRVAQPAIEFAQIFRKL
jgi:hypothetical protein